MLTFMMKLAAATVLVIASLPAAALADHRLNAVTSYDVAVMATRMEVGGGQTVPGRLVRFGPRIIIHDFFELGCDLDIGSVQGDTPAGVVARGSSGVLASSIEGRISAAKIMAGGHWGAGWMQAGVDLAVGLHAAELTDSNGLPIDDLWPAPVAEGRTHLDAWVSPHFTLGVAASVDLHNHHDASFGLVLGIHPIASTQSLIR